MNHEDGLLGPETASPNEDDSDLSSAEDITDVQAPSKGNKRKRADNKPTTSNGKARHDSETITKSPQANVERDNKIGPSVSPQPAHTPEMSIDASTSSDHGVNVEDVSTQDLSKGPRCHQCRTFNVLPATRIVPCTFFKFASWKMQQAVTAGAVVDEANTAKRIPCAKVYCSKCLSIRYGEDADEILSSKSKMPFTWKCPSCRNDCNCSVCRKRRGLPPTGQIGESYLLAGGVKSVQELLRLPKWDRSLQIALDDATDPPSPQPIATSNGTKSNGIVRPKSKKQKKSTLMATEIDTDLGPANKKLKKGKGVKRGRKPLNPDKVNGNESDSSALSSIHTSKSSSPTSCNGDKSGDAKSVNTTGQANATSSKGSRPPRVVLAPTLVPLLSTRRLSSAQIQYRLEIREFTIRFRHLLTGLGGSSSTNKDERARGNAILASMDDPIGFWSEDESGMRAILSALVCLAASEAYNSSGNMESQPGSVALIKERKEMLALIKKEVKTGATAAARTQAAAQCWETAKRFLAAEGFAERMEKESQSAFIEPIAYDETRGKCRPEDKVCIISAFIDIALRCQSVADEMIQGVERERIAKVEIVKNRAKVNRDWNDAKTSLMDRKPSSETLFDPARPPSKQKGSVRQAEEARIQALDAWEAEMKSLESDHREQMRGFAFNQYTLGVSNRLRFSPIGVDTRGNRYYILAETPDRAYPDQRAMLSVAWSFSVIMNGSIPDNSKVPKISKKTLAQRLTVQSNATSTDNETSVHVGKRRNGKDGLGAVDGDQQSNSEVDMLEDGDREVSDQWLKISEPHEIRQLAAWIGYEASLVDWQQVRSDKSMATKNSIFSNNRDVDIEVDHSEMQEGEEVVVGKSQSNINNPPVAKLGQKLKQVSGLMECCLAFADFVDVKVAESEVSERGAMREARGRVTRGFQ